MLRSALAAAGRAAACRASERSGHGRRALQAACEAACARSHPVCLLFPDCTCRTVAKTSVVVSVLVRPHPREAHAGGASQAWSRATGVRNQLRRPTLADLSRRLDGTGAGRFRSNAHAIDATNVDAWRVGVRHNLARRLTHCEALRRSSELAKERGRRGFRTDGAGAHAGPLCVASCLKHAVSLDATGTVKHSRRRAAPTLHARSQRRVQTASRGLAGRVLRLGLQSHCPWRRDTLDTIRPVHDGMEVCGCDFRAACASGLMTEIF